MEIWSLSSFLPITVTCKCFWKITFSGCTFFNYFHGFEISVKFGIFWILICKKEPKHFWVYEYYTGILECKFARNGLTNWKNCLTNIFLNIIWHLFAGESHQVEKITVTYCVSIINGKVVQGWAFSAGRLVWKKITKRYTRWKNRGHTKLPGYCKVWKRFTIDNCKLIKYYSYYLLWVSKMTQRHRLINKEGGRKEKLHGRHFFCSFTWNKSRNKNSFSLFTTFDAATWGFSQILKNAFPRYVGTITLTCKTKTSIGILTNESLRKLVWSKAYTKLGLP